MDRLEAMILLGFLEDFNLEFLDHINQLPGIDMEGRKVFADGIASYLRCAINDHGENDEDGEDE